LIFHVSFKLYYMRLSLYATVLLLLSVAANIKGAETDTLTNQTKIEAKIAIHDSIIASGKFVETLDSASFYNLPIAIMGGSNADPSYCIAIDQVKLFPTYATFNASMVLTNPFDGKRIVFVAENVAFTFKGGIQGSYRLELVSESGIDVCKDIGLTILSGSYVECDCNGFKSLYLKGKLDLSPQRFALADAQGNRKAGKVTSYFETNIQDWNDLTFTVSFDPFQLKDYPDFTFICTNLAVDMSDYQNPSVLKFPVGYESAYSSSEIELWRGIYIGKASVILSKKFKEKNADAPLSISVENLIVDEQGFSGKIIASNLLSLDKGSMGGWKFSVQQLSVQFVANNLTAGSLSGQIHIPVFADSVNFNYAAAVDVAGNYSFIVNPASNLNFNLFGQSKLTLYKTSYISITSDSSGFVPVVNLTGKMTINASVSGSSSDSAGFKIADLEFQDFRISTKDPVIDIAYMAYTGSDKGTLSKFPLTISSIIFRRTASGANLTVTANVNLKGDDEEGFSGSTTLTLKTDRDGYKYTFAGIQIDKIRVCVEKPGSYKIDGSIAFSRGDIVYGNGFRGELKAEFSGFGVEALAIFGNVKGLRYFFVDAFFSSKKGIQAGPVTIFGLGGGLYHHMKQQAGEVDENSFGASLSGIVYKPDNSVNIGFKASATFGVVDPQIINGKVLFEMVFSSGGGISSIAFEGAAACIAPELSTNATEFKKSSKSLVESGAQGTSIALEGPISAYISMKKDFESGDFHAEMNMKVNIANAIKGIGADNRAGWAVLHASDGEWYLYIGTPADPIGIEILGMVKTSAYFMAGYNLPATFTINPKVADILGLTEEDLAAARNETKLETGKGIAFGASYSISTGDLSFLAFYANFSLGMGFDLSLIDYGSNAYCAGSSPPLGINGWYAKGQAYAYFSGTIGVKVKIFGKKKKFDILSIATAAYLKAEAPNPVWLIGYVGGSYRILGGMVKGKCNFKVEVGEKCDIQRAASESALADLQLIGDLSPEENGTNVDVFTTPQVVFNVPINSEQNVSDDDGNATSYRVKLNGLSLTQGADTVTYDVSWNASNDVVQMVPSAILTPLTSYNLKVSIKFEEKVNGVWKDFIEDSVQLTEERSISFTTGELPDKIPASEISYTYPVDRQYNFMPGEYDKAYMMFRRDVNAFFAPSDTYTKKTRWTQGGSSSLTDISYNAGEKTLYMNLPSGMGLHKIYKMEVVAIPISTSADADRNVTSSVNSTSQDSTSTDITTKSAEGTITTTDEKVMFACDFKTSKYNTFASRFNSADVQVRALYDRGYMEFYLVTAMPGGEGFDDFEINGVSGSKPLIGMTANLGNTSWFTSDVNPKTYQNYPWFGNKSIYYRDTTVYGLRAEKAISAWQTTGFSKLTDSEIEAGTSMNDVSFIDIAYMPAYYWNEDYMSVRDGLAFYAKSNDVSNNAVISDILTHIKLRPIKPGTYPVTLSYSLPGKNVVTSTRNMNLITSIKTDESDY
jgi:hypothetical protein